MSVANTVTSRPLIIFPRITINNSLLFKASTTLIANFSLGLSFCCNLVIYFIKLPAKIGEDEIGDQIVGFKIISNIFYVN